MRRGSIGRQVKASRGRTPSGRYTIAKWPYSQPYIQKAAVARIYSGGRQASPKLPLLILMSLKDVAPARTTYWALPRDVWRRRTVAQHRGPSDT